MKQDLSICPGCGGTADNGHDRCYPPNPYYCSKCMNAEQLRADFATVKQQRDELVAAMQQIKQHRDSTPKLKEIAGNALESALAKVKP